MAPAAALVIEFALVLAVVSVAAWTGRDAGLPDGYVDIADVSARPTPAVGGGTFTWSCGRNEEGHRNTANVVVTPGWTGPAHHTHDYVGNLDVDPSTDLNRLAAGPTTCANGDASTYFWPVLRRPDGGGHQDAGGHQDEGGHHDGVIQVPAEVTLTFSGSAQGDVLPMPPLLRGTVGDAYAATNGGANARPVWTCGDRPDRRTTRYPVCAPGERVTRLFDFPSCWDGRRVDSADHRAHLAFAALDGSCPRGTFALPRLRLTVAYDLPAGARFVIDAFAEQRNDPSTDHAFFVNGMPAAVMSEVVACVNGGRHCVSGS